MTKRAEEPLERRDVQLFKGDWEILGEIVRPLGLTPTEFIRKLVRKTIIQVKTKAPKRQLNDITIS